MILNICEHNKLPLFLSSYMCSQSPHSFIDQTSTEFKNWERCELNHDVAQNCIFNFFNGNMFFKYLTLINHIFSIQL